MGSLSESNKYNKAMNDSLSINSVDNKSKLENTSLNLDNLNNNQISIIQSETRESTKITELKEEIFPYKFIWNQGGKNVKIAGTFLENWRKEVDMEKNINNGLFEIIIFLTKSKHEFKFIVDGKWVCSQQYEICNDKNNLNNIIDLTNYIPNEKEMKIINEKLKQKKRKCSREYGCNYILNSGFDKEIPSLPSCYKESFNINKGKKVKVNKKNSQTFLNFNFTKNILENNDYKTILTISHEKLSHIYCECNSDYKINENKYIKSSITQRCNHKFLTLIYYTPKKNQ